ncbi:MAG: CCA tRNA nucleotidyltransferase [Acidobacteria bacterium]|nr:CCA tRNA nucleotidyltransferase [Acidobacteriota bacterium]
MSDYMFMLESHLSADQARAVNLVQSVATGVGLFLTGGAMRDMLGGFPIRDLDFTVEGNALKLAKAVAQSTDVRILSTDDLRKSVELLFPGDVTVSLSMAREERYLKPAGRPHVVPATIHEDLRSRDFTINSIALSLNRASLGLLLDPNNGLADLERKELRAIANFTLYDDPVRLLRLIRFKVRFGFAIEERTRGQYENARLAEMESHIPSQSLLRELSHIANEPDPGMVVQALDEEKLLTLFAPALSGAKLNLAGLAKLLKAKQMVPFGADLHLENLGIFLYFLTEKLTPKEKTVLANNSGLGTPEIDLWQKLETRCKKLERDLKSAKLQKASQLYHALSRAPGDQVLFLLLRSPQRLVQDRIKNYLQKYLPTAQEVSDRDVIALGLEPGTPKFQKAKDDLIATRLDSRPRKPAPPPEPEPEPAPLPPRPARSR